MAQVLTAHGVRGELKCRVITDFPEQRFKRGARLLLGAQRVAVTVRRARLEGNTVLLQLEEIGDRDAAVALRGLELVIPRTEAGSPPKGEFFWHEVIGLTVAHASTGETFGKVSEILETGANDVYIVKGDRGEILVPATKEVVKLIDPPAGHMLIEPLPGMIPHQ